ncbi:MAG: MarR family transcriptional regulator, partial [Gemmatimonadetes bacterium]|nr:MarR family transcriptional regulator [Gemmatimonadota bacterium]
MPNPETRQFIERMGLAVERMGLTRTFGRLFGLLMVADRPLSLDEIVERLDVSKASVSTNARACEELGLA